jgi:hypothetical protein
MLRFSNVYYGGSGFGIHDCCFLGQHFLTEHGFRPDRGESWVLRSSQPPPGKLGLQWVCGVPGWHTGMWRSTANHVYVTELCGRIHICRNLDSMADMSTWERVDFKNTIMQGVWGLNDQCVFAWCKIGLRPSMLFWNGKTWAEMPAPPEEVAGMHGTSPELVYAVGANGLIARWDGRAWTRALVPTQEFLISVHVESADEMYAVGHGAALWEGSASGWGKVADGPGVLQGVAKFGGEVWVGGQKQGLLKRERNKLTVVNPDLHVNALDSRKVLLITTYDEIAETTDGKSFTTKAKSVLGKFRDPQTPLWGHEEEPEEDDETGN